MVVIFLVFVLIYVLAISGAINLIISIILIKLRRRFGKTLLIISLACLTPFTWLYIEGLIDKKQEWDRLGPLIQAIDKQDYKKVERCIQKGYSLNVINYTAYPGSPLSYAVDKGNFDIVKLLVENGADVNLKPVGRGMRPLNEAIFKKDLTLVTYLLENGADVLQEDEKQADNRPVWYAIRMKAGNDIIEILKKYAELQRPITEKKE